MMMYLTLTLLSSHPCDWFRVFHQMDMQSATPREMSTQAGSIRVSKILIHPIKVSWSVAPALEIGFPNSTAILEKCLFMNDDILIPCTELPWDFCRVCKVYNKRCRGTAVWFDRSHGILDPIVTGWQTILCYWRRNQACYHSTWGSKGRLSRFQNCSFVRDLNGMLVGSDSSTNSSRRVFSRWWITCRRPTWGLGMWEFLRSVTS